MRQMVGRMKSRSVAIAFDRWHEFAALSASEAACPQAPSPTPLARSLMDTGEVQVDIARHGLECQFLAILRLVRIHERDCELDFLSQL